MAEIIVCPGCGRKLQIDEEHLARMVQCPACHNQFRADSARPAWASREPLREGSNIQVGEPARLQPADTGDGPRQRRIPGLSMKPRPKSAKRGLLIGLIAAISLLALGAVVFIIIRAVEGPKQARLAEKEDQEQRRRELLEAFKKQKPLAVDEIGKELKPLFHGLGQAFKGGDGQAIVEFFDTERMLDEMVAQGFVPKNLWGLGRRRDFVRGMREGMARSMGQQAPLLAMSACFLKNMVRCLIKLKRIEEAVKEAERIVADKVGGDRLLLVLAHAASGDVKKTIAAVDRFATDTYLPQDCYRDPDLGPILRSPGFQAFRKRFPENQMNLNPVDDLDD